MELIKYTNEWLKGEIFEGKMILAFGLLLAFLTFCFWKFGFSTNAKAMIIPLLLTAILHIITGAGMIYSNNKRAPEFNTKYQENPQLFKESEIKRVDSFVKLYPLTRYVSIGVIILGFCLFNFLHSPLWKSIGLCIMVVGFSIIVIDYFSEERALIYQKVLLG